MVRVVQISDPHLFADPDARLRGVPTDAAFRDVLAHVDRHHGDFDLLVLTGDLAHDEDERTYERLWRHLGDRISRCRLIPGNHDQRSFLRSTFGPLVGPGAGEFVCFAQTLDNWHVLGLDTHVPGEIHGRLEPSHLQWLRSQLLAADGPTVVFMHHPPISVQSRWLEEIALREPEAFCALVGANPGVKAICTGHVHHEFSGHVGRAVVKCAPSTAIQFRPRTDEMQRDEIPPGYCVLELEDQAVRWRVVRLPDLHYPPEPN